jgi:hypothetical protein
MRSHSIDVPGVPGTGSATRCGGSSGRGVVERSASSSVELGASVAGAPGASEVLGDPAVSGAVVAGTTKVRATAESVLTPSDDEHAASTTARAPAAIPRARRRPRGDMARMVRDDFAELAS